MYGLGYIGGSYYAGGWETLETRVANAIPFVMIELDTVPPILSILGAGLVEPPADISLTVTSSEDIGWVDLSFIDSLGDHHDVGSRHVGLRTLMVSIPSVALPLGEGTFRAAVADTVCNVVVSNQTVVVGATRSFDVSLGFERGLEVDEGVYHGYEVAITIGREEPK